MEDLAGDPGLVGVDEPGEGGGDVVGGAEAAEGMHFFGDGAGGSLGEFGGHGGFGESGGDGVDADAFAGVGGGGGAGEAFDGAFGGGDGFVVDHTGSGGDGGHEGNAAAGGHFFNGFTENVEAAEDVDAHDIGEFDGRGSVNGFEEEVADAVDDGVHGIKIFKGFGGTAGLGGVGFDFADGVGEVVQTGEVAADGGDGEGVGHAICEGFADAAGGSEENEGGFHVGCVLKDLFEVFRLFADFVEFVVGNAVEIADLQAHAGIGRKGVAVALEKIPVEGGEGAGVVPSALGGIVAACLTIVAHALDIFSGGGVGFAGHDAAVGILRHAEGVGEFDPFDGVEIDGEVPFVGLAGIDAEEKRKESGDHEALNVVGVAVGEGLFEGIAHAGHVGVAGPVECGQIVGGVEGVFLEIAGHVQPIDAADVFAPADDLADEAFGSFERNAVWIGAPGLFHCFADGDGVDEFDVEGAGESGVVEERFFGPHGILIVAKVGEAVLDEIGECRFCLSGRDWPVEGVEIAGMIRKSLVDFLENRLGDFVGRESFSFGQIFGAAFWKGSPVGGIVVPFSAFGIAVLIDQESGLLAHFAVEVFHAELFAAFGMFAKGFG